MYGHGHSRESESLSAFQSSTFDKDVQIRVNEAVGSASISPSGRDVVLASREGLHIIDLDAPFSPPRYVSHRSQWEVADVQWSPFSSRDSWIVSTSNQKALVWNLNLSSPQAPIEHTLHAHTNAITDINFSAQHPDLLATCAVDSFVHCWDLRRPSKPIMSFAEWFSGATQVKWNRQNSHIIASSHQRKLMIWDDRKGAYPLREIDAHATQIYGVDWNRLRPEALLTCSLDGTIKFWDYTNTKDVPERVIKTPYPVWRARHTPFGWGVLAMPKRHDFNVHMYDRRLDTSTRSDAVVKPTHSFQGHEGQVKEFLWRSRGGIHDGIDERDFQLVSWGMDRYLRLHQVDEQQLASVGHKKGSEVHKKLYLTRAGAVYRTFRDEHKQRILETLPAELRSTRPPGLLGLSLQQSGVSKSMGINISAVVPSGMQTRKRTKKMEYAIDWMGGVKMGKSEPAGMNRNSIRATDHQVVWDTPESLSDEITYVGKKYRKVNFELADINRRTTTVTLTGPWGMEGKPVFMRITFKFPASYPIGAVPIVALEKTTSSVTEQTSLIIKRGLRAIAEHYVMRNCGCLEAVITYLLGERGLEDSLALLSGVQGFTGDDSSSDDDEGQDLELSAGDLSGSLANANVPLPKACGAVWAEDGRLICFFPPRPDPKPRFDLEAFRASSRFSKSGRPFEDLERTRLDTPEPQDDSSDAMTDAEDNSSEISSNSSTSSSSASMLDVIDRKDHFISVGNWYEGAIRFNKSSTHSSGGVASRSLQTKPKSRVAIFDTKHLLPAKVDLAKEYRLFGDGPSVCAFNAEVARKHCLLDLACVWELIRLILFNKVPLDLISQTDEADPILVVARNATNRISRGTSATDNSSDRTSAVSFHGRIKWSNHPMASKWLIQQLFDYFEKLADIQMLALMTCIFYEPAATQPVANLLMRLDQQDMPMAMKCPAFSLEYRPFGLLKETLPRHLLVPMTTPSSNISSGSGYELSNQTDARFTSVFTDRSWSIDLPMVSEHIAASSTSTTPPRSLRFQRARPQTTQIHSTSPDRLAGHSLRRTGSNVSFLNSIAAYTKPMSPGISPPAASRMLGVDVDLSTSAPTSSVTWGETTVLNSDPSSTTVSESLLSKRYSQEYGSRLSVATVNTDWSKPDSEDESSGSSEDERLGPRFRFSGPRSLSGVGSDQSTGARWKLGVTLKNQDRFEDESHASRPLLDPVNAMKHAAYRGIYAEQLSIWQLQIQRAEVLKFNGLTSHWTALRKQQNELARGDTDIQHDSESVQTGSQAVTFRKKESSLTRRSPQCTICWLQVEGLHVPCTSCDVGRAHKSCVEKWTDDVGADLPWCTDGIQPAL